MLFLYIIRLTGISADASINCIAALWPAHNLLKHRLRHIVRTIYGESKYWT